jgi:hypothetical protein
MESEIRSGFESRQHELAFGEFTPENLRQHDLIIPLSLSHVRQLDTMRDAIGDNPFPIPSLESIAICDDKLQLNRALIAAGLSSSIPRLGLFQAYPYILKKRIDEWGLNSQIVFAAADEASLADKLADANYFRQEYIHGRIEYTAHVLFKRGRIAHSMTVEFVFESDVFIKGHAVAERGRSLCDCPYLELFGRILALIGFEGLCCFNYKVCNGQPLIFEINPRFGGSLAPLFAKFISHLESDQTMPA